MAGIDNKIELERRFVLLSGRLYMLSLQMLMFNALNSSELQMRPKGHSGNLLQLDSSDLDFSSNEEFLEDLCCELSFMPKKRHC